MRKALTYSLILLLPLTMLYSCNLFHKKKTDWHISLTKNNKNPYGSYLAYHSLLYTFPNAKLDSLSHWFKYNHIDTRMKYNKDGTSLLVLSGLDFYVSDKEWKNLVDFAAYGNEIVLFCSHLDQKIQNDLKCQTYNTGQEEMPIFLMSDTTANQNVLQLKDGKDKYGYKGRSLKGYFYINKGDTSELNNDNSDNIIYYHRNKYYTDTIHISRQPDTLSYSLNHPNCIRYNVGRGHITINLAPLSLSNYFLLQNNNIQYLEGIWFSLPKDINHIYWDDYYKHTPGGSLFGVLLRYPATRWAFFLALITLLLYVLFDGKRRQRIIPIIKPVANTSVSFVETVGRLYFNKGSHSNLAHKMIQHFLEWVRAHYFINTNHLNEQFIKQLVQKSGMPESQVRELTDMIHEVRLNNTSIDEAYLYKLYNNIQDFYKNYNK